MRLVLLTLLSFLIGCEEEPFGPKPLIEYRGPVKYYGDKIDSLVIKETYAMLKKYRDKSDVNITELQAITDSIKMYKNILKDKYGYYY